MDLQLHRNPALPWTNISTCKVNLDSCTLCKSRVYPHDQQFHRSPWTSEQLNSLAVWYASVSTTAGKLASIAGVNDERRPIVLRSLERCSRVRPLCIFRASTGEYDIGSFMLFDYIYFRSTESFLHPPEKNTFQMTKWKNLKTG